MENRRSLCQRGWALDMRRITCTEGEISTAMTLSGSHFSTSMRLAPMLTFCVRSFRPERWEDGTLHERIGWGYLPFNGGPRICLGRKSFPSLLVSSLELTPSAEEFALLEASYTVARIVQSFPKLGLPADERNVPIGEERQSITLTLAPAEGCRVRLY